MHPSSRNVRTKMHQAAAGCDQHSPILRIQLCLIVSIAMAYTSPLGIPRASNSLHLAKWGCRWDGVGVGGSGRKTV
eukprot:jgi/Mesvir1/11712/Mv25562-RA.1